MKPSDFLTELSNDKLTQYKTAAAADASKADKEGDFKKGDKRFSGIVKATKKQFDNDAKKGVAEGFSNDMSTEDMIAYLRQHHDKNLHQDYLNHITSTNIKFVLKNIPLTSIRTELSGLDRDKVEQYKKMDFSKAPPIVVGSDGNILDGYHRATVAKALGIPTIKAYVGVKGQQGVAEGSLGTALPWPNVVNKVSGAMKAMGWKGTRKADGTFMFSTRGQETDDQYYIVIIDNAGEGFFTYALGTIEEGDPRIGEQESLPNTEASVSELMNAIRDGFGLSEQGVAEGPLNEFAPGNGDSESGRIGTLTTEANPNQQLSKYNPNGKTYRGVQNKMPTLEPDPVDNAVRWGDDDTGSYEQNFGKEEMKRIIAKHLDLLDEKQKKVLKLRFWDGMTTQEVASVLNVTQSRITQIENKAMRVLKVKFYKSGITPDSVDIDEGWSQKYKSSINCSHPKGFSQKAHCAGKKKHNESIEMEMVCEDCGMCETHTNHENLDEACWKGYHKEGNKKMFGKTYPNCVKNTNEEQEQHSDSCPHCGGELVSEELINEKKDACYYKVKSRYKVWPSAYASGALVKCRNKGANNWGNGGKKNESSILEGIEQADESLHDWFNKEKWVRMDTKGNIKGPCAKEPGEGKPKCLPQAKAHSLGKKGRASAAARKRREDPNPDRSGKAINVNTKKTKG